MRTGSSFSWSMMVVSERANTSLPEPGPPCTTNSIGRAGLNCAKAGLAAPTTSADAVPTRSSRLFMLSSHVVLRNDRSIHSSPVLGDGAHPQPIEPAEQRDQQDHERKREHDCRDRPL